MNEQTIELELPVLLPEIHDEQDECLIRLKDALVRQKGIIHAHLERDDTPIRLCIHYQPNLISLDDVRRIAHDSGAELTERYRHAQIPFTGMDSADAAITLRSILERLPGILHAQVNYAAGLAFVAYDTTLVAPAAIAKTMRTMGVDPVRWPPVANSAEHAHEHLAKPDHSHDHAHDHAHAHAHGAVPTFVPAWMHERWELVLVGLAGVFLLIGWAGETFFGLPAAVALVFFLLSYMAGGYDISTHAIPGLFRGKFDTDVLMLAAAAGAAVLGEWAEGAFLLFLFGLGHAGEHYALDRARNAVNALGELMPSTARVKVDGQLVERPVGHLRIDNVVFVPPGERIPVDGRVLNGNGTVDQSSITGESVPVYKKPGDEVFAGTINEDAGLDVKVTRLAKDNTLARVMKLVAEAQSQQSPSQRFAEKFTARFVPAVLIFVLLVIAVPPLLGWMPLRDSFYTAMLLLVAASPCALALGTPASVLAGIAQAARNGVLIKGGAHLENLGGLKVMAFDKTGTLTHGKFKVIDIVPVNGYPADEVLALAASVEQGSNHPLARAVVEAAHEKGLPLKPAVDLVNFAGRGLRCTINGQVAKVGSINFFHDSPDLPLDEAVRKIVSVMQTDGTTIMVVQQSNEFLGVIGLSDTVRLGIRPILNRLREIGMETLVMLTGDSEDVARNAGAELGVTDVRAGLLPEQKQSAIQELQKTVGRTAMVGDGVNDAPALASATVGIAMGGAGTAVALETADIALMGDDLTKLPFAVGLSRASRRIIRQNLGIALGVIGLLIVTSVLGVIELSWAVVLHEGSSVVVVLNALRLLGFRQDLGS